jgi:hypothetical protein
MWQNLLISEPASKYIEMKLCWGGGGAHMQENIKKRFDFASTKMLPVHELA